ncbi:MAG: SIS domain-containing protein, partial [Desulfatiglandales bacterium]
DGVRILRELETLPSKAREVLKKADLIEAIAQRYHRYNNWLFLGRKYNYPTALEGALKLKEVSYIHAEGYAAGEMKHGPIALINPKMPTVAIITRDEIYEKMINNIQEVKSRRGPVIAVCNEGDEKVKEMVDEVIEVPETLPFLSPILNVIPLQLLAYHCARFLGRDIDKPRNLAKSVTVE